MQYTNGGKSMKRIMSMLLSTALVFTLTACGSGNGDSQSSAVTETTQEMQKESTATRGKTRHLKKMQS